MGRVFSITWGARSRYFSSKGGLCSENSLSGTGRPQSTRATLIPASASRLHAQPPEAPEPTTTTSYVVFDWSGMAVPLEAMHDDRRRVQPALSKVSNFPSISDLIFAFLMKGSAPRQTFTFTSLPGQLSLRGSTRTPAFLSQKASTAKLL